MMTPVLFTFQIILLALGFGIGYLFLIQAKTQENRLKTIGEVLGWTLIAATIILEILSFTYSINVVNTSIQKIYYPIPTTNIPQSQYMQQQDGPTPSPENTQPAKVNENQNDSY